MTVQAWHDFHNQTDLCVELDVWRKPEDVGRFHKPNQKTGGEWSRFVHFMSCLEEYFLGCFHPLSVAEGDFYDFSAN